MFEIVRFDGGSLLKLEEEGRKVGHETDHIGEQGSHHVVEDSRRMWVEHTRKKVRKRQVQAGCSHKFASEVGNHFRSQPDWGTLGRPWFRECEGGKSWGQNNYVRNGNQLGGDEDRESKGFFPFDTNRS